jgi:hypothetical protein
MLHMFHTYVASVLRGGCICFVMAFQIFLGVFANISYACFKCFIYLQMYVVVFHLNVSKVVRILHNYNSPSG